MDCELDTFGLSFDAVKACLDDDTKVIAAGCSAYVQVVHAWTRQTYTARSDDTCRQMPHVVQL